MKNILLATLCAIASMAAAQDMTDGYQITAKTSGIQDTTVYLINVTNDTIGTTKMRNGLFFFEGKVNVPQVAYIRPAGTKAVIPLLLENCNFQIMAGEKGVQIVGGELQAQYERYSAINRKTSEEQARVQKEMQTAMQEGNQMKMQGLQNDFMKFVEKVRKEENLTFDSLVNTLPGIYALSSHMQEMPREMVRERYEKFNDTWQRSSLGMAVDKYLEQVERIMEGKIAPDFTLANVENDSISLHNMKGKVKLVDFWASWCGPCRKEMPNLVKLYKHYQTKGLEILGVSIDDKEDAWKKACFEEGVTWKSVRTPEGRMSPILQTYNIQSIPFTVLLDADNRIVAVNLRGKELENKIAEMLK